MIFCMFVSHYNSGDISKFFVYIIIFDTLQL